MGYNRFITDSQMEKITSTILINNDLMTSSEKTFKVDIDYLIEFEYDLEIEWKNIDHLSNNKDGIVLAAIFPKDKLILMNETKTEIFEEKIGAMNFSKAHELGHWILHVTEEKKFEQLIFLDIDRFYCRDNFIKDPKEIQANMFAASLLMPKIVVQQYINDLKVYKRVGFGDLYKLSDKLEVSISALVNRINNLELLYITNDSKIYESKDEMLGQLKMY